MPKFLMGIKNMNYLAFLFVLLAFCTHCTEGDSSSTIDRAGRTHADSANRQTPNELSLNLPGKYESQKAIVDPETGRLIGAPEHDGPAANEPKEPSTLISPAERMEEKPSPVPGGGMMIDLKGRFQRPLSATIEHRGKAEIERHAHDKKE